MVVLVVLAVAALGLITVFLIWSDGRRYEFKKRAFHHKYWLVTPPGTDPGMRRLAAYHREMQKK